MTESGCWPSGINRVVPNGCDDLGIRFGEYDATGLGTPVHLAGDVHEFMDIRPITQVQHMVRRHLSDSEEVTEGQVQYSRCLDCTRESR